LLGVETMTLSEEMTTAASSNDVNDVRRLLDDGEDINATNESGETAFSYACANDALEVAKLLYAHGANINTVDNGGGSPLDWAVCWSSTEFRDWLKGVGGTRHDDSYTDLLFGIAVCKECKCEPTCSSDAAVMSDEHRYDQAVAMQSSGWVVLADNISLLCPECVARQSGYG
jgi:hypothetical protein